MSFDAPTIPADYLKRIAHLLRVYGGLNEVGAQRFLEFFEHRTTTEYRFMGALGSGAKFYNLPGRWYVATYPDEETQERAAVIALINVKLAALRTRLDSGRPAWLSEACGPSSDSEMNPGADVGESVVPETSMEKTFFEGAKPAVSTVTIGHATTQGPRDYQEDAAAVSFDRVAVFDGLGGHGGGDRASQAAAKTFAEQGPEVLLRAAVELAHTSVLAVQRNTAHREAATTVAAARVTSAKIEVCWAGDSRVYVYRRRRPRGSRLVLLTKDHNYGRHVLARCLGTKRTSTAEIGEVRRNKGDVLILSTDGLHEYLYLRDMEAVIAENLSKGPQAVADALVAAARAFPTQDNATVLVVRCDA